MIQIRNKACVVFTIFVQARHNQIGIWPLCMFLSSCNSHSFLWRKPSSISLSFVRLSKLVLSPYSSDPKPAARSLLERQRRPVKFDKQRHQRYLFCFFFFVWCFLRLPVGNKKKNKSRNQFGSGWRSQSSLIYLVPGQRLFVLLC